MPPQHRDLVDPRKTPVARLGLLLLLAAIACKESDSRKEPDPRVEPTGETKEIPKGDVRGTVPTKPSGPPVDVWSALPEKPSPPKDPDGIPILRVTSPPPPTTGPLRELSSTGETLEASTYQASDGLTTFIAVRSLPTSQLYSDVVIRGGELRTNALQALGGSETHLGGCGAAADGTMLLSGPAPVPGETDGVVHVNADGSRTRKTSVKIDQHVWIVEPSGKLTRHRLPPAVDAEAVCSAAVERTGRFSLLTDGVIGQLVEHDGKEFRIVDNFASRRTRLARALGSRYCFGECSPAEVTATDATIKTTLETALGGCQANYAVYGDLIGARCKDHSLAVRMRVGGELEKLTGLPEPRSTKSASPYGWITHDGLYFTRDGDLVIELEPRMKQYFVWPAGSKKAGPERVLPDGEVLAWASPIVRVQNLPDAVPPAVVEAVELGARIQWRATGDTYGYRAQHAEATAHEARTKRATDVLPEGDDLVIAHEAVVQRSCGAYVRSPLGHEGEEIQDYYPPALPALFPEAVHVPPMCLPLEEVHALPGDPDLLLARTKEGQLAVAWLPPPLPLPQGRDPRSDEPVEPPPVQHPQPGSGWTVLAPVDRIAGNRGLASPGTNTAIRDGSWQAGGGAVLEVGDARLVLTPRGVWTLPPDTKPMAVQTGPTTGKLYGVIGPKLVVCETLCRTLDTADPREIVAVVPRTETEVVLGFATGEAAVYTVPTTGGVETPAHALEAQLEVQLAAKPKP
jgi:hypothetical protein